MDAPAKRNWFIRHKIWTAIILIILIAAIAAAANGNKGVNNTPTSGVSNTSSSNNSKASNNNSKPKAHVGDSVNVGGSKGLAVTLQQVIDPAQSDSQFITPDAGKRFVAAKLQIVNNGTSSYNDDANNNITIIGSDNQSYTASFMVVSGCTNFSNGQYTLAAGASATGCVNFEMPNGVKPTKVQFTSQSGFSGSTGEWLVP
jgi:hypothetical protein